MNLKLAMIVVSLVPEANEESNSAIKKDIRKDLSIPWLRKVEKVTVCNPEIYQDIAAYMQDRNLFKG